jgi:hypothetical protein
MNYDPSFRCATHELVAQMIALAKCSEQVAPHWKVHTSNTSEILGSCHKLVKNLGELPIAIEHQPVFNTPHPELKIPYL